MYRIKCKATWWEELNSQKQEYEEEFIFYGQEVVDLRELYGKAKLSGQTLWKRDLTFAIVEIIEFDKFIHNTYYLKGENVFNANTL